jgi:hypothetical protein
MENMNGFLQDTGAVYSSRTVVFTPGFLVGSVLVIFFSFLCFVLVLSHVCSEVACVSRLSILDCVFRLL